MFIRRLRIYLDGNYYSKHCGGTACLANPAAQWMLAKDYRLVWDRRQCQSDHTAAPRANLPLSSALPYTEVESYVTTNAGARPLIETP